MRYFVVNIEGKQYQVGVEEVSSPNASVAAPAPVAAAPVAAPAPTAAPAPSAGAANGTQLTAPMPGMIKKFSVAEGAKVTKGQVVYVLEAMKMDNDITAPCDGTISFKTSVGSNVDTGAVVAVIA